MHARFWKRQSCQKHLANSRYLVQRVRSSSTHLVQGIFCLFFSVVLLSVVQMMMYAAYKGWCFMYELPSCKSLLQVSIAYRLVRHRCCFGYTGTFIFSSTHWLQPGFAFSDTHSVTSFQATLSAIPSQWYPFSDSISVPFQATLSIHSCLCFSISSYNKAIKNKNIYHFL